MCEGVDCDDNNECTYDVCDPATGTCEHFGNCDCVDCNDDNECTDDVCDLTTGMCTNRPLEDGTDCGDSAGTCQAGSCTFARTEQGIRDAIAFSGGPYEARTPQGDPTAKEEKPPPVTATHGNPGALPWLSLARTNRGANAARYFGLPGIKAIALARHPDDRHATSARTSEVKIYV